MNCVNHPDEDAPYQCYLCRSPICVECETKVRGLSVCVDCLAKLRQREAARYEAETRDINYPGALVLGLVAALAAAFAWSQFAVWVDSRLPVAALLLGGLVGYAVMAGAGGKRSPYLQQMGAVLALGGTILSWFLIFWRTQSAAYVKLFPGSSELSAAVCAFPEYVAALGALEWLSLALGAVWAYWVPHVRSLSKQAG